MGDEAEVDGYWYFLTFADKIRKRTEDTIVALHPESIQGIVISQGTEVH